jgi:hypothetical protein
MPCIVRSFHLRSNHSLGLYSIGVMRYPLYDIQQADTGWHGGDLLLHRLCDGSLTRLRDWLS